MIEEEGMKTINGWTIFLKEVQMERNMEGIL
jgi:hypothetical protein